MTIDTVLSITIILIYHHNSYLLEITLLTPQKGL